jgi:hypothetical protein
MIVYVASRSSNSNFALEPQNVIAVCYTGPRPEADARSYAYDVTKATDQPTWVYRVDLRSIGGYKVSKEVIGFGSSEQD